MNATEHPLVRSCFPVNLLLLSGPPTVTPLPSRKSREAPAEDEPPTVREAAAECESFAMLSRPLPGPNSNLTVSTAIVVLLYPLCNNHRPLIISIGFWDLQVNFLGTT